MITRTPTSIFTRLVNTETLARRAARHPGRTIVCWLVVVAAAIAAAAGLLGSALTADSDMTSNPESIRAQVLIDRKLPHRRDADEVVIVRSRTLTAADPASRAEVAEVRGSLLRTGAALRVGDPYRRAGQPLISRDQHAAMLPVVMGTDPDRGIERLIAVVQRADTESGLEVRITGTYSAQRDFMTLARRDLQQGR